MSNHCSAADQNINDVMEIGGALGRIAAIVLTGVGYVFLFAFVLPGTNDIAWPLG